MCGIESVVCNMDCMEALPKYPDKYFDLAVVDPPYGIGIQSMNYTKVGPRKLARKSAAKSRDYRRTDEWDVKPPKEYFDQLFRVSKRQIIWGGNYFSDILPPSKSFVVWDKRCSNDIRNQFADCEYAWTNYGVARMFRYVWNGMLQGNMANKEDRFHPTQKPIALYEFLLDMYAKPGDKILDTHLGSGSSRIAAYSRGLDFVGYEIDKEYYEKQEKRFQDYTDQIRIGFAECETYGENLALWDF